jgi:hypothetical protein
LFLVAFSAPCFFAILAVDASPFYVGVSDSALIRC